MENLRVEYKQINVTKIEYLKTLLQMAVVYLTITGFAFNYVVHEVSLTPKFIVTGLFDVLAGAIGFWVVAKSDEQVQNANARLKVICKKLKIEYQDDNLYSTSVKAILACYLLVVLAWFYLYCQLN